MKLWPQHRLRAHLGESHPAKIKGSTRYFVHSFCLSADATLADFPENAQLSFEAFQQGLLLRIQKNNQQHLWPLRFSEITSLKLLKGQEQVNPLPFSPMDWLLKLGFSLDVARYLRFSPREYRIAPIQISLQAEDLELLLHCNGYLFNGQRGFFSQFKKELGEKLEIVG